jgi:hypothetical protein
LRVIVGGPSSWRSISKWAPKRAQLVEQWLIAILRQLQKDNQELEAISSLHLGLDTLFAKVCQENGIPYHVVLSCPDQDAYWDEGAREIFKILRIGAASETCINQDTYSDGSIVRQFEAMTNWVIDSLDGRALLLVKKGQLSKTQAERKRILHSAGAVIRTFYW